MQSHLRVLPLLIILFVSNIYAKDIKVIYSVALVGMSMNYSEYDDNGNLFDTETSSVSDITGVGMGYKYLFFKGNQSYSEINFDVLYVSGYSDYTGSLLNTNNPFGSLTSNTLNNVIDINIDYMHNLGINSLVGFHYGVGLGYRLWQRELSRSQIEIYEWFSIRPKFGVDFNILEDTFLNVNTEYQYGFNPTMQASGISSDFSLGGADILRFDIGLSYILGENVDMFINGVYEKQVIEKSNTIVVGNFGYYEPDSTAYNKFVKIGLAFKY